MCIRDRFNNTEHAANLFGLKEFGNIYSRLGNPTVGALEARLTALEDGAMCVALSSGTSAVMYSLINIMSQGDNFVTANQLYGGTYTMFDNILPEYGIDLISLISKLLKMRLMTKQELSTVKL